MTTAAAPALADRRAAPNHMLHCWCRTCYPHLHPGDPALCGYGYDSRMLTFRFPPHGWDACVVCLELAPVRCQKCGR